MREFSDFEKRALMIISKVDNGSYTTQNFETLVRNLFSGLNIGLIIDIKGGTFKVKSTYDLNLHRDQINENINQLVSIQLLFEYLESLFLIRFYNNSIKGKSLNIENKGVTLQQEICDRKIVKFYCDHWTDMFCVTESLRTFVLVNDFKTDEQIRFETQQNEDKRKFVKQLWIAYLSFGLSFLGLLAAIIIPLFSNTKLNKEQLLDIKQSIEGSKVDIPTKINTVITNDTLRVDVVKFSSQQSKITKNN